MTLRPDDARVGEVIGGHEGLVLFLVARVVGARFCGVLRRMVRTPATHRFARFLGVVADPLTAVFPAAVRVLERHEHPVAGSEGRDNGTRSPEAAAWI